MEGKSAYFIISVLCIKLWIKTICLKSYWDQEYNLFFQRKLDGYEFPVYSTPFCPRNTTEWSERSSYLNCTESNGYTCLPNENFTELLEFCYRYPFILIEEGNNWTSKLHVNLNLLCHVHVFSSIFNTNNSFWIGLNFINYTHENSFDIVFSGNCLYLVKSVSLLNGYNCQHFKYGCPSTSYVSNEIYKCKYHGELPQLHII